MGIHPSILEINVGPLITCIANFGTLHTHLKSKVDASSLHYPSALRKISISTTTCQRRWNVLWYGIVGWGRYGRHTSSLSSRRHHATFADDGVSLAEKGNGAAKDRDWESGGATDNKISENFICRWGVWGVFWWVSALLWYWHFHQQNDDEGQGSKFHLV